MSKKYPNVVAVGRGYVVTDDHSGGLVFPRHPVGAIRQAAYGRGIRSDRYGFQRDQVGGNRIPRVGLERRIRGLGRRVHQPAELIVGRVTQAGKAAVAQHKPAKPADVRPGAIAKRAARAKRAALAAREQMAAQFNAAIRGAQRAAEEQRAAEAAAADAIERVARQRDIETLVATFNGGDSNLKGGL